MLKHTATNTRPDEDDQEAAPMRRSGPPSGSHALLPPVSHGQGRGRGGNRNPFGNGVRSQPLVPEVPAQYAQGGYVGALVFAVIAFTALWLLNGLSTAWASRPLFYFSALGVNRFLDDDVLLSAGVLWGLGWALHVGISLIERHLWRTGRRIMYWISLPSNFWDMTTASLGIKMFFTGSVVGGDLGSNLVYVLLGTALSLTEIPLIITFDLLLKELRK